MLSDSCYLTTLFYAIALYSSVLAVQLKYEQSLSCTKCQQSEDFYVFCVCFDVIRLDVSVEAINVSVQ